MENLLINSKTINDFLPFLCQIDIGKTLNEKFRISLAIGLFMSNAFSLERASELAQKTINEFLFF